MTLFCLCVFVNRFCVVVSGILLVGEMPSPASPAWQEKAGGFFSLPGNWVDL